MAGRWRVLIEGLEEVANPSYRPGDKLRTLKHHVAGDEEMIKDIVVEVGYDDEIQKTNPFGINADGKVKLGAVLFVKSPPRGKMLTFRVVKEHKIQKDALIGEVSLRSTTRGREKLTLMRHDKPRGFIVVEVSDGVPSASSRPPTASATASAAGTPKTTLPAAALKSAPPPKSGPSDADVQGGGAGGLVAGCMDCVSGVLELLGLRDADAAFMQAKAKDPAVKKLDSGLMYKVIKRGNGRQHPSPHEEVKCHYTGRFTNGKVFDSSLANGGEPITFRRSNVIAGWKEALGLMVEGDKWELYIPGSLAYGADGDPSGRIKPNAVLWFEMELLRIVQRR